MNDIDNEGTFVSIDGNPLSYTNWFSSDVSEQSDHIGNNQPNDYGGGEDVVIILGFGDDSDGYWGDTKQTDVIRFVCSFDIPTKFSIHGRTHLTGIEFSNKIFGSADEVCSTCIIEMDNGENVKKIRYRSGITDINVRSLYLGLQKRVKRSF